MSYDVSIGDSSFNYTSNVAALFYDHIPAERSRGGLHELHGLTGKQASELLRQTWGHIHSTYLNEWKSGEVGAARFRVKYDPPNGWGSTVGALIFLAEITSACHANPRKKVSVDA